MITKKIKKIGVVLITLLLIVTLIFIVTERERELETNYIYVSYVYDQNNPYEVVGYGDHVFVAKVNGKIDTIYTNVKRVNLFKRFAIPYTQYSITVVDNIKGRIELDAPIIYQQFGGISINKRSIDLVKGDKLLESGAYYIIVAASGADGIISSVAPIGHMKLNVENEDEILSSKEYRDFVEYYKNEIPFNRDKSN